MYLAFLFLQSLSRPPEADQDFQNHFQVDSADFQYLAALALPQSKNAYFGPLISSKLAISLSHLDTFQKDLTPRA